MTHVRQRLSLLGLGVVAAALAFAAIAVSGSPTAAAFDEEPYTVDAWVCDGSSGYFTDCDSYTGYCTTTTYTYCDKGMITTEWTYPYESSDEYHDPGDCYIGLAEFNYCP